MDVSPEVYLHVNNGGVTFKVRNDPEWGPVVEISQSQFAAVENTLTIKTTPESLQELARLFMDAAEFTWGEGPDLEAYLRGQTPDPWDDIPRASVRSAKWVRLGSELEMSPGKTLVAIRPLGDGTRKFLITKLALKAALDLFRPSAKRVARKYLAKQSTEVYAFEVEMDRDTAKRFQGLLAMLHYNSSWGHSSLFGMWCDGDGADHFHVVKGLDEAEDLRKAVSNVGSIGGDVEVSSWDSGKFRAEMLDRDRDPWLADAEGSYKILDD